VEEQTLFALARHDGVAEIASFNRRFAPIESQPSLLLDRAMALVAVLCQQRLDVANEIYRLGDRRHCDGQQQAKQRNAHSGDSRGGN